MTATTDYLLDRRRLRRKLGWWRMAAIAAAAIAALIAVARLTGADSPDKLTPHIARLSLQGMITGDKDTIDLIKKIGQSNQAKAVLLTIDSPGGTTTGAEKLYNELRRLGEKKPVVAVVGTVAASGAYIAALATDTIVAESNSLVGSVGVLFQYPNFYKLLDSVGVKVEEVKSSPLKASPNGYEPTSEAAKAAIASLVTDSYAWFKDLVKERRRLDDAELAKVADGRVFTARQGVPLKLVDVIGGEREAVAWLETNKNIAKDLPVRDWKKKSSIERLGLVDSAAALARVAGLASFAEILEQASSAERSASLDGLLAIWQGFDAR
ncbi:signal peptide peptidase SppA [Methylocystis sp. MJC1]|jgi:protease-4|uniref:signal peptide peptidase SppA n=1 Tax=Methylocystis sp. MJC1 TaxID=2654282 RepID=UPI0013EA4109|nr:signal peptide peptidase SppA [Methylocystis sp. MJC1]KAF2989543.1 putative signal peptide peptidase SppA [Methylocystis sp. MJC1]MBU6528543.1 signal peptide peptidase SppA [Methylocystis sp. MJC1]UZX11439.1 signal peptide peptidase SppA [Methylocystis sp. MJC1]